MTVEDFVTQYHTATLPKPTWLTPIRESALNQLEENGFPTLKDENWKYTRSTLFIKDQRSLADAPGTITAEEIAPYIVTTGDVMVFIDGCYIAEFSKCAVAKSLNESFDHELVKQYLTRVANMESGFTALNTAMINEGVFLVLNGIITQPIQLLYINTGKTIINHSRNLIIAESNSQAHIIETYVALESENYFNNIVSEIVLHKNSHLTISKIQQESNSAQHISSTYIQQEKDSTLQHVNVDFGSQHTRNWLQSDLTGENASCDFNGLYLIQKQQHIDNHTRVEHQVPHTTSLECYKGILTEQCRGVFNGQVYIAKDAQKTCAEQQNANLLLAKNCEIDTKPQLEIYADDVKCAHGATIGQLDTGALFYLKSRGLDDEIAKNILLYSFAKEIIAKITHKNLQDYITLQLLNWLPNGKEMSKLL